MSRKLLSVVTISFNQAAFLRACIDSVLAQKSDDIEYIVVDPGSTDGSREIIAEYGNQIDLVVSDKDGGAAEGLNNGFARASGDVLYYLNSDDTVLPGAFSEALEILQMHPMVDVVAGSGVLIDMFGMPIRKIGSDPISRRRLSYGSGILIQPSTFIRRKAFEKVGGFNPENKSNWDGELVVDLFRAGAHFLIVENLWGCYRLHGESITSSGRTRDLIKGWNRRKRDKLGASQSRIIVFASSIFYRIERLSRQPSRILDRLRSGRVFGRAESVPKRTPD